MTTIRFRSQRAKKWWLEAMNYLKIIRNERKFDWTKRKIEEYTSTEPLRLTRAATPQPPKIPGRLGVNSRLTYPLSSSFIDFDVADSDNAQKISSYLCDDHLVRKFRKYRRKKKKRRSSVNSTA